MSTPDLILGWLQSRVAAEKFAWLRDRCLQIHAGADEKVFFLAFSQCPRYVKKNLLQLDLGEQSVATAHHAHWDLKDWTLDQSARAALLASLPHSPASISAVMTLYQSADLGEHIALAKALFLSPQAKELLHIGREAIRSNMLDVFKAFTQRNPYAAEYFDDLAWNQMVVKCLFVDVPLEGIQGLDKRRNAELSRMIVELAQERRAAKRTLSPEAWRCVMTETLSVSELEILKRETKPHG